MTDENANVEPSVEAAPPAEIGDGDASVEATPNEEATLEEIVEVFNLEEHKGKKIKLNVNGEEQERSLEEWLNLSNKGLGADARFAEASKKEKELLKQQEKILKAFQSDPIGALQAAGYSPEQIENVVSEYLAEQVYLQSLQEQDPNAYEDYFKLKEYEKIKEKEERFKKQQEEKKSQQAVENNKRYFETKFKDVLSKSGLPATEYNVWNLAHLTDAWMAENPNGEPDYLELASSLKDKSFGSYREYLQAIEDEQAFYDAVGPELLKKFRYFESKRASARNALPVKKAPKVKRAEGGDDNRPRRVSNLKSAFGFSDWD